MSEGKTLEDKMKLLETAASLTGLWILTVGSAGTLMKAVPRRVTEFCYVTASDLPSMDEATTPGIWSTGALTDPSTLPSTGSWNSALAEIFKRGSYIFQRLTNPGGQVATRVKRQTDAGWPAWKVMQYS